MPQHNSWQALAPDLWSLSYAFRNAGLQVSTRMTVARLRDGRLFAHSAVPLTPGQKQFLDGLGPLRWIVAPSTMHHLFAGDLAALYPEARLYGPPGLKRKRPDLQDLQVLEPDDAAQPWSGELSHLRFEGIPLLQESLWFHHASGTLIATDILQCWQGPLSLGVRLYLGLTGGHERLTVPRTVRLLVKDRSAARRCAQAALQWPIQRVVLLHNSVLEDKAFDRAAEALSIWTTD
jgi:hypothetical protein